MRILYFDIDSLRPDHLGCYGYSRNTSPHIDQIAAQGVRFENYYASDVPCLPSRTALWSGRFGVHNGVVGHAGTAADPFPDGAARAFNSTLGRTNWMRCLRDAGLRTVAISSFAERHTAWHWYAGFSEVYNPGFCGMERADQVAPIALDWIARRGREDNWFLHVNLWDPHTPYRTPAEYGEPFGDAPLPAWLTEDVRQRHWQGCGPHSAQEVSGFAPRSDGYPRQPEQIRSMADVRRMFDGYDTGIRYADDAIGRILNALADLNVLEETAVILSADHGENLGELNIYGDHQTADNITARVPLIVRWPGLTSAEAPRADTALHYHIDFAATLIDLIGGAVPQNWDGVSFAKAFLSGQQAGRDFLVLSQGAWSCQRAVRWNDYLCIRSYHDGYHGFPDVMLFDLKNDPHEQHDLAPARPDLAGEAMTRLDEWQGKMRQTATHPQDPLWTVLHEGGPDHTRGELTNYLKRLRETDRSAWADSLLKKHPNSV